ncbi:hypothetical protein FSP39_013076, partial [Pinctada imbricata]
DGPLSLQDSYSGSTMDVNDTGQTTERSGQTTERSKTDSPMKESSESRRETLQSQNSQNSTSQMNGAIDFDELCSVKNLKEEELLPKVKEIVQALKGLEEYDRGETMKMLKSISDTYWSYKGHRHKIGDILSEEGFGEITMKILKTLNSKGIFKNDSIWFPVYYCFNVLWNYSDASLKVAKDLADNDGVRFFTVNCDHEPYLKNLHSKNVYYVVKASMSILQNIARNADVKKFFKECDTSKVMLKFAKSEIESQEMLRVLAMLTLAHTTEEEENEKIIDETGVIDAIVKYTGKAVKNPKRRHLGFTPHELIDGLSKLAVNDSNKKKIIDAESLPIFLDLLKGEFPEEQAIAAKALWNLSFDKDVATKIKEHPEMMESLEKLKSSYDKSVQRNVNGLLFVLKGENDVSKVRPKSGKRNKGHVFLSYSWNEKDIVMKLRERLKQAGYEVWIDVERMGGSTLSAMADAVENAAVVIICMSEKYKQSPNCRLEAEYTYQLRKDYIPLMLQRSYRPDGWLGMILGAKLYFDFSGKYPFEKPWNGLTKELKSHSSLHTSESSGKDGTDAPIVAIPAVPVGSTPGIQRSHSTSSNNSAVLRMTTDDVSNWLRSLKLDGCVPSFAQFDGRLLSQLRMMKSEAAEYYYHSLEKQLGMNLVEILTFTEGLEKL